MTLDPTQIAERYAAAISAIEHACRSVDRDPATVRALVATKYIGPDDMPALATAGIKLVGENQLQSLAAKQMLNRDRFEWHFIGKLQSRKVREIAGRVSTIHSLESESAVRQLNTIEGTLPKIFVQVNTSGEESKGGVGPNDLAAFIAGCKFPVAGLMTMPPLSEEPEGGRPYFRQLAALAKQHGIDGLSIGTSQDFTVAVQEGATIVRLGATVLGGRPQASRGA